MIRYGLITLVTLIGVNTASANIRGDLGNMFDSLNFKSNVSGPSAFKDQSSGFYTAGGVHATAPVRDFNPINIQAPNLSASCHRINAFWGSISILQAKEMLHNLKGAIPATASYGLAIAMQTMVPQIYNTIAELQDWIQKVNAMNVNSCRLSALALAGVLPKTQASSQVLCQALALHNDVASDYADAAQDCARRHKNINSQYKTGEYADILGDKYNLVWKAIRKNTFLQNDHELSELFMSVSGTILKKENSKIPQNKPSLAFKQDLLEMLLFGNEKTKKSSVKIYGCNDKEECLDVTEKSYTLDTKGSVSYRVERLLLGLTEKVITDQEATMEERGLVNATSIPIMKIIAVEAAYKGGRSPVEVLDFKDEIASDILLNYLDGALDLVHMSLQELEQAQIDGKIIERFKQDLRDVRAKIHEKRKGIYRSVQRTVDLIQRTQNYEKQLLHNFNEYSNLKES